MRPVVALGIMVALGLAACGEAPVPTPDLSSAVRYWVDLGGSEIPGGEGQTVSGLGGWTSDFACGLAPDDARPDALRFDDSAVPGWDLGRDGGTPPPLTRSGMGVSLRVEPNDTGAYMVTLGIGDRTYLGSAPVDAATIGFHHVSYERPPELLAFEKMPLATADGSALTLTGSASFPDDCSGI